MNINSNSYHKLMRRKDNIPPFLTWYGTDSLVVHIQIYYNWLSRAWKHIFSYLNHDIMRKVQMVISYFSPDYERGLRIY